MWRFCFRFPRACSLRWKQGSHGLSIASLVEHRQPQRTTKKKNKGQSRREHETQQPHSLSPPPPSSSSRPRCKGKQRTRFALPSMAAQRRSRRKVPLQQQHFVALTAVVARYGTEGGREAKGGQERKTKEKKAKRKKKATINCSSKVRWWVLVRTRERRNVR